MNNDKNRDRAEREPTRADQSYAQQSRQQRYGQPTSAPLNEENADEVSRRNPAFTAGEETRFGQHTGHDPRMGQGAHFGAGGYRYAQPSEPSHDDGFLRVHPGATQHRPPIDYAGQFHGYSGPDDGVYSERLTSTHQPSRAATDHRTSGTGASVRGSFRGRGPKNYTRSDERILDDLHQRLANDGQIDASDVDVRCESGTIVLEGTVEHRWMKHRIEDTAEACSGVRDIDNRIRVTPLRHAAEKTGSTQESRQSASHHVIDTEAGAEGGGRGHANAAQQPSKRAEAAGSDSLSASARATREAGSQVRTPPSTGATPPTGSGSAH